MSVGAFKLSGGNRPWATGQSAGLRARAGVRDGGGDLPLVALALQPPAVLAWYWYAHGHSEN